MNASRFAEITGRYSGLRIAVVGDFFLDRYLLIDPSKTETSIETGLPVYNVVDVRAQPGAAGTILNNLSAIGVGAIHAVGFRGDDGEGYELQTALSRLPGVRIDHFLIESKRRTPVYCKPLIIEPNQPPRELSRFDTKNWTPTPNDLQENLASRVRTLADQVDVLLLMDQVDRSETGVVTSGVRRAAHEASLANPGLLVMADSRQGLGHFPPLTFKMNAAELATMNGEPATSFPLEIVRRQARSLAERTGRAVFVTLAERGIVGATPGVEPVHVPSLPVLGPIDIVGAGDAVTASLAASLAAGAELSEAMEIAMVAASIVIHQLGTTGTAPVSSLAAKLGFRMT